MVNDSERSCTYSVAVGLDTGYIVVTVTLFRFTVSEGRICHRLECGLCSMQE